MMSQSDIKQIAGRFKPLDWLIFVCACFFLTGYLSLAVASPNSISKQEVAQTPVAQKLTVATPDTPETAATPVTPAAPVVATTTAEPEKQLSNLVVSYIDVGQGDSELLQLPDGKTMLIDAGVASEGEHVVEYLRSRGVTSIDYLVASHPHADHIGGLLTVIEQMSVGQVWMPDAVGTTDQFSELLDLLDSKGLSVNKAEAGQTIVDKSNGYEIKVLGPQPGTQSDDLNAYSAVIQVTYKENSFLFTGDAPVEYLLNDNLSQVDVLKAAHHGSKTGTTTGLLNVLSPAYIVLSYGTGNDYGHPHQAVLDAIKSTNANLLGTGVNGTIVITSDGENISVETSKTGEVVAGISAEDRKKQEEEKKAQEAAAQKEQAGATANQQVPQETKVVVTPKGKKYHYRGCRTLSRSKHVEEVTVDEAKAQGYEACKVCNPPALC